MKMKDITAKKDTELTELLSEKREELRAFRFHTAGSALRDVRAARTNKKIVARVLTEMRARTEATA